MAFGVLIFAASFLFVRRNFMRYCFRYCAKVSCPTVDKHSYQVNNSIKLFLYPETWKCFSPQIDCYTRCADHVAGNVSGSDWHEWGLSLMSQCGSGHMTTGGDQGGQGVPGVAQVSGDKLSCADTHLWSKVVR